MMDGHFSHWHGSGDGGLMVGQGGGWVHGMAFGHLLVRGQLSGGGHFRHGIMTGQVVVVIAVDWPNSYVEKKCLII
jgi:hypothetical protein